MLALSRLLTCGAGRRGPVAGTGPAAGTRTQDRPARLVAAVWGVPAVRAAGGPAARVAGGPAARVAWGTRMRGRPVLAPMA